MDRAPLPAGDAERGVRALALGSPITRDPVWIISVPEPLFYGAMYVRLIESCSDAIAGVIVVPDPTLRGARRVLREVIYRLRFWGAQAFLHVVWRRLIAALRRSGDVAAAARRRGIAVHYAATLDEAVELLRRAGAQRALASVPIRVRPRALATLPRGWVNTHLGPLPRYGGVDAPFWCLYHREPQLSVTLHYMAERFDTGPIIDQQHVANDGHPYFEVVDDLFRLATRMHVDYLRGPGPRLEEARAQNPSEATYFGKPPVEAGRAFRRRGSRFV